MFHDIKHHYLRRITLIVAFQAAAASSLWAANAGVDLAKATLADGQALAIRDSGPSNVQKRDSDLQALRTNTTLQLSKLTQGDRVDYVEYMANQLAKIGTAQENGDLSELAMMLITAAPSLQELADGSSRLIASSDPGVREVGMGLLGQSSVRLANGETGQDISVFDLALHDPKVPQDRLIGALFKLAPVESAQWFADHAGLPADKPAGFESDLQKAWKLHRALNDPNADKETKAALDGSVKNPLLDRWLHSPSWILRAMANGLLQKRTELQTPDLTKAMQPVQVPKGN